VTIYLGVKQEGITGQEIEFRSSGNLTTNHTFKMTAPDGAVVQMKCGYIDGFNNYREMDGGCTVTIEPGRSYP